MGRFTRRVVRVGLLGGAGSFLLLAASCRGRTTHLEPQGGADGGSGAGGPVASGAAPAATGATGAGSSAPGEGSGGAADGGSVPGSGGNEQNGATSSGGASQSDVPDALGGEGGTNDQGTNSCGACSPLEICDQGTCRASEQVRSQTEMVEIPGGSFWMGTEDYSHSSPVHQRRVETFLIDRTEVTVRAYKLCLEAGACSRPALDATGDTERYLGDKPGYDNYPINYVAPHNAEKFCAWMGKRLPTETEWEYAAGGNLGYVYPWGDGEPYCCYFGCTILDGIEADYYGCAVAQFPAMANGLFDMTGGFWELTTGKLCSYDASTADGYASGCDAEGYVLRGGSIGSIALHVVQYREPQWDQDRAAELEHVTMGFRCARSP